ncbi:hydroxysqualene dehydroxylase HpnE [Variovorax dokdonensis]|uniref:Hydroxysqualene dehydroxylase HpnE n=1 Tax=Variovorax dokdonensis TaxID=344883 RepID=A0ABT7N8D5_9BURK|nr:hydroxysqualene dehydroxylase HpnE [Variovorax dokdonensis]MDM0044203.1 hydroxysqualene dehydroxylase HpnE [Variovorax dokdonensis]
MRLAIVGAGWAGLACAVHSVRLGHEVHVFEAARTVGGRARRIEASAGPVLDNGQHILIGAYSASLALMRELGVDPDRALLRLPLRLRFADGNGIAMPRLPAGLDLLAGIATARGWSVADKLGLVRTSLAWRFSGFRCAPTATVADLCRRLPARVMAELIEPLCVSALNTPVETSSGQVFLRVLHDALFAERGGADLLLPRVDLGQLLPDPALAWLKAHGATLKLGHRVQSLRPQGAGWQVDDEPFDHVVLACAAWDAARLVHASGVAAAPWLAATEGLRFTAITTVYADGARRPLDAPVVALRSSAQAPAQFVFDRGQLGGPSGLLAFVVSASDTQKASLEEAVLAQGATQLGEPGLRPVRTVIEKRATFACTPALNRPPARIADGLWACGDYVEGPYPATLEGAVRCAAEVARALPPAQAPGAPPVYQPQR